MTGSLQAKGNMYYAVLNFKDESGKRLPKWFKTGFSVKGNKKRAKQILDNLLEHYSGKEVIKDRSQELFSDYVEEWIDRIKPQEGEEKFLERSTWETYESHVRCHIIPYFKDLNVKLSDLTKEQIEKYYKDKSKGGRKDQKSGGLGRKSIKDHAKVLRKVLDDAVDQKVIFDNVARNARIPKTQDNIYDEDSDDEVYLTAEEANEVLRAFQGHRLQPLVYITLYYGLRRSEIIGIKWSSLDFQKMALKIRDVIVKSRTIEEKSRTKTRASKATFDLLPEVRDILLEIKKQQQKFKSFYGNQYHDKDYVFCWDDGTPYRPDYITKAFQAQLKKSGLPKMKFHSLRHSCASVLYDKGWELKDIQEWLRHTKIETTGDIYVHISKNRKKIMGEKLSGTFHL